MMSEGSEESGGNELLDSILSNPNLRGKKRRAVRRRRKIERATPRWLTPEARLEIHKLYCWAKFLNRTWRTGHKERSRYRNHFDVDHIVPLDGKRVCGLHVPWNLRITERLINNAKGDKIETELMGA